MTKEFDIYLRDRIRECEISVYSIPQHLYTDIEDSFILESCIAKLLLYKYIAVQSDSVLVSRIDAMLKTCQTLVESGIVIGSGADAVKNCMINLPEDEPLIIHVSSIADKLSLYKYANVQNGTVAASVIDALLKDCYTFIEQFVVVDAGVSVVKTHYISPPEDTPLSVVFSSGVGATFSRYAILADFDDLSLEDIDNMALEDLDYFTMAGLDYRKLYELDDALINDMDEYPMEELDYTG